jgi:hypothetical protein
MSESTENCGTCRQLTNDNFRNGFLIDGELIGAVGEQKDSPGNYFAYILNHATAEYLAYEVYPSLDAALTAINQVQRDWAFDKMGGCSSKDCGKGNCSGGKCKVSAKAANTD